MDVSPDFLDHLADVARREAARFRERRAHYENKLEGGFDPVTEVDWAVEQAIRSLISGEFPDDGIRGEELGATGEYARRTWSIDPIDGTRAFICGLPSWAILVGVVEDGNHVAGLIDLPMLDERLIAVAGQTRRNGDAIVSSACSDLASARISTTDPFLFEGSEAIAFERVRQAALVARYGLDALAYARIATGDLDLVIESGLKRHDLDALVAVVRGAGGAIGDWNGGQDWDRGRIVAASTAKLYSDAVALLSV